MGERRADAAARGGGVDPWARFVLQGGGCKVKLLRPLATVKSLFHCKQTVFFGESGKQK